ncbi:hypothetical protein F1188_04505 [Roseospira marina]|uniref:Exo-alpha-sialidase n=1 Tax=Roseospira marina TaxID=140057 RepID=A0A5M6IFV3_9PROT|nr:hypothetical protein [Roseospira marina]KAA5606605.1 hypothetical protein F1188_04505 [Roseospira marina]MBB4313993.1 hypothetical protein [Roseospira marina]MBB5087155.1 hypothetical protein [Roseospira marina]
MIALLCAPLGPLALAIPAQGAPCQPLATVADTSPLLTPDPAGEIRLALDEMTALPPRTVILAGAFYDPAGAVQPALLTSSDGGASWTTHPVRIPGAALRFLAVDRAASAWGIVSGTQEGTDSPLYLLRSRDGAETWCAISLAGLETLHGVDMFRMFDDRHGLLVMSEAPFGGDVQTYETRNGGEDWALLWRAHGPSPDAIDAPADDPDRPLPSPPHATLWRADADRLAAHALLRLQPDDDGYTIERREILGDGRWHPVSRIPAWYRGGDDALRPRP